MNEEEYQVQKARSERNQRWVIRLCWVALALFALAVIAFPGILR